jgi:hypothetical protein
MFAPNDELRRQILSPGGYKPKGEISPIDPLSGGLAMDKSVDQQALDLGTQGAPLAAPVMGGIDKISPLIEYLLQMLGNKQQPAPSTTSQQTGPYRGPIHTPTGPSLRGNMMGGQAPRDPNTMY